MRSGALILALLLIGCNREPSFDERYAAAEERIRKTAAEIDAELAERERLASEAAAAPTGTTDRSAGRVQAASSMNAAK